MSSVNLLTKTSLGLVLGLSLISVASANRPSNSTGSDQIQASNGSTHLLPQQFVVAQPSVTPAKVQASLPTPTQKVPSVPAKSRFHLNGFLSAGASQANVGNSAKYVIPGHGSVGKKVNFAASSLVGLQLTANLTPKLDLVTQIVANGDDTNGNKAYRVNAEWAFLRYHFSNNSQLRVGRFRLPLFLYSDTQQVGYTYPWLYLPNEVYRLVPFSNMNGASYILNIPFPHTQWSLSLQPFYGTNSSQYDFISAQNINFSASINENDIIGSAFTLGNKYVSLRGAYAHVDIDGKLSNSASSTIKTIPSTKASFYSGGVKINYKGMFLIGEYAQRSIPDNFNSLRGYYGTVGFTYAKMSPYFTYAHIDTVKKPTASQEPKQEQTSLTLGVNYYLNSNVVIKASSSYITPEGKTNGLFNSDLDGKKHIMMFGGEVDAVF